MVGYSFHYDNSRKVMGKKNHIKPQWLELLLKKRFFGVCKDHKEIRKSEVNIYCIECDLSMCSHCVVEDLSHHCHKVLQIRRYLYQDVVRIQDMRKLVDCSKVQAYTVNNAKVLLLNARKQSKPSKIPLGSSACRFCRRIVMETNCYCSIACKAADQSIEEAIPNDKSGPLIPPPKDLEDLSPKEENESTSSLSSSQPSDLAEEDNDRSIGEEGNLVITTKMRVSRRKGIPRRAPMF